MTYDLIKSAALEVLQSNITLSRKAGSFLGQCVVDDTELTDKQHDWLLKLCDAANVKVGEIA